MLAIEHLKFTYGGDWILRDLSVSVSPGQFIGLIGPNGSGKTTLLKTMAGYLQPGEGSVRLKDRDMGQWKARDRARIVASVPQENHFLYRFSVLEVVLMGRAPHGSWMGFDRAEDIRAAMNVLRRVGLEGHAGRDIQELSGGERQMALIGRALAQEPEVLLLDEPTAFLDLSHQLQIYGTVRNLVDTEGLSAVSASHDLNLAAQFCDRLILLKEGQIEADGNPSEILNETLIERVYGTRTLVDRHPVTGRPRITLIPGGGS